MPTLAHYHNITKSVISGTRQQQRESLLSQQSSLYPPSTVTSGPETPSDVDTNMAAHVSIVNEDEDAFDDVSYRLRLLVKNNYFLPPPHAKPLLPQQPSSNPVKSPTIRNFFRPLKSPKNASMPPIPGPRLPSVMDSPQIQQQTQQSKPSITQATRPQNRVVVIREQLRDLAPDAPQQPLDQPLSPSQIPFDEPVDPTTAVDIPQPLNQSLPAQVTALPQENWRKDLLQQAVGLSLTNPPPRSHSLSNPVVSTTFEDAVVAAPSPVAVGNPIIPMTMPPVRDNRNKLEDSPGSTALRPPPRPARERTRTQENQTISSHDGHTIGPGSYTGIQTVESLPSMYSDDELVHGLPSPVHSAQSVPYSSAPFGGPLSPPPRFSGVTEHTQSTSTLVYAHDDRHESTFSRTSLAASSQHSAPRPSFSESHVSHFSATFGERGRDSGTFGIDPSKRKSPARLTLSLGRVRSRSMSPSRSSAPPQSPPPMVPPLPSAHRGSGSETEDQATVIYVHPTGALSNTAVSSFTPTAVHLPSPQSSSPRLDPRRGITNTPSPTTTGFFSAAFKVTGKNQKPNGADIIMSVRVSESDAGGGDGDGGSSHHSHSVESWRDAQAQQARSRRFEGMLVQHIESEKDRFKQIAMHARP